MAYQFFAKAHMQSRPVSSPSPTARFANRPPIHPPPIQPPRAAVAKAGPTRVNHECFPPYPHAIPAGYTTSHPHVTVEAVDKAHIASLKQITGLLLPIRYPNSFYDAITADPVAASLSRVAVYHDHPIVTVPDSGFSAGTEKVIGGIRCRLERQDPAQEIQGREATNLYIQTLHLLSPYRGHGVAAALLNSLLFIVPPGPKCQGRVSELVKHYNIRSVTAHVHEANEDGLRWYVARGFKVQDDIVEDYYRRLKPSSARIVRLDVQWEEDGEPQDNRSTNDLEDEDWEKVEAQDSEEGEHGVQALNESRILEVDETLSRKRKAEEESGNPSQRR
ncbi:uncharacterized protein N7459_001776 [Penicillium hispanicum]|uniref:uncharacterized protein n=1 Tax=Penicillium hispanicum TaxID=1080232 RepID=UPI00253FE80C|nr:uncharacterized protein N7459_001776 [Penicillium hispanicum]KAJ5595568.1 hypothetical protein N7459_001776 [Penicillium hispanicum]